MSFHDALMNLSFTHDEPQVFGEDYPDTDAAWNVGVLTLAPAHHRPASDAHMAAPTRDGFFSGVLTTVHNPWFAVEAVGAAPHY